MNKRNAQGGGTIRQRPNGRWEARYTTGKNAGTGKQTQRSIYGATQAEVRKKLTALLKDIDTGIYQAPAKITVKEWLETWQSTYLTDVKPFTLSSYKTQINVHLIPALGAVKLSALNTPQIQKFYNSLTVGEKPLSAKTVKNIHGVLHRALQQAVDVKYLLFNPCDACKLPRIVKKEIHPLDEKQSAQLLTAVQGHKYESVYQVTLFTGMREGEILGLQWSSIHFQSGTITINQQLQREKKPGGKYYLISLKNDKTRTITPAPFVMEVLLRRKTEQLEQQIKAGSAWHNEWGLVFTDALGKNLCGITVYKCYKRIVKQLGIPESRFHDLRHSYAVAALQSGDDVKTVQENLGHATASFTLDVYGHVTEKMKQDSANRMQAYIESLEQA